jgi:hypothetical protein
MGYAQRHPWPAGEHWSLVVSFCGHPKANHRAAQATGLLDRKRKLNQLLTEALSIRTVGQTDFPVVFGPVLLTANTP